MAKVTAPVATRRVKIAAGVRLYTGIGHAPFMGGRVISMRTDHADALMTSGHVTDPAAPAVAAAPHPAAPAMTLPASPVMHAPTLVEHVMAGPAPAAAVPSR
jgi:hypothetical protein